ncbi:shikimate dehydrogenase family protein [Oceanomicrobium pacificus]|uniref:Shikimate dehydrogenase n=1 Tax=Oceanomicrobium pacificus TaxID=2692916 RepID=A0A6B0TY61_9RHOB|nr:shikimate dehydrogenase [Oceanomicrobium pacificus]MXU66645.1 shikimate dehydrogenase [Oceanomicrobium pacificus]
MSDAAPLIAGLIGAHIGQSRLSAALGRLADATGHGFEFTAIDSAEDPDFDFAATVADCREKGWTGVTVTHPHKTEAAALAGDGMLPRVAHLGACNTLVFDPDHERVVGHNTDYTGFKSLWRAEMPVTQPGRVAMAGAGGVARAIAPALLRLEADEIAVWDPEPGRAAALAADFGSKIRAIDPVDARGAILEADGLVNATALGMGYNPGTAFDPKLVGGQTWAFDAVYTPPDTPFLTRAADQGLTCLSGFDLFRHMAVDSFEAYLGTGAAPADALDLLADLRPTTN